MIHSRINCPPVKRSFIIFALLCTVLIQATAQNWYKNEIAVSDKISGQIPGAFGIEYFRRLGNQVSVGAFGGNYTSSYKQHIHFSFQASLLGVEVGKRLRTPQVLQTTSLDFDSLPFATGAHLS